MTAPQPPRPSRPAQVWQLTTLLLYQYQGMLRAPAWALLVVLSIQLADFSGLDPHNLGGTVASGEAIGAILALVLYFLAALGFATSLGFDDRQDRSVLFWMALPVPVWVWLLAGYLALSLGLVGVLGSLLVASLILRVLVLAFALRHGAPLEMALPDLFGHWTVAATLLQILPLLLLWWLPVFSLFMAASTGLRSPLRVTLAVLAVLVVLARLMQEGIYASFGISPGTFLLQYFWTLVEPLSALTSSDEHGWASLLQPDVRDKLYFGLALGAASAWVFLYMRRRAAAVV